MQQAIDILKAMKRKAEIKRWTGCGYMIDTIDEAIHKIEALGDGWIPVTERLPEKEILAVGFQGEFHIGYISKYEHCEGYFCEGEDTILDDVTHWQPLPLPPKQ